MNEMKNNNKYCEISNTIMKNVERDGLSRYDRVDIKFRPSLLRMAHKSVVGKYIRYAILAFDECFPIILRKIFGAQKSIPPTTYSFLAGALFNIEKYKLKIDSNISCKELMDKCLKQFMTDDGKDCWWDLEIDPYFDVTDNEKRRTMHIHGLARCNIILLKIYKETGEKKYFDIAYRSAYTTIKQHNLREYRDGTLSISYYPYTDDCTLNICSEFSQWLAMIISVKLENKLKKILESIVQLIINEQQEEGGFPYCAKQDESPQPGKRSIDCHHSATVLGNLIAISKEDVLGEQQAQDVANSINKGMFYFINTFAEKNNGELLEKWYGPTQYGETVIVLCKYQNEMPSQYKDEKLSNLINLKLPAIVETMSSFIDLKDGSCPSEKVIKWQYLNSIRWGNGVILNALTEYVSLVSNSSSVSMGER